MAASGMTRYLAKKIQDHVLKVAPYTPPTHLYVGYMVTAPDSQGNGTECTDDNYHRQQCDTWAAATDADPDVSANGLDITFPAPAIDQALKGFCVFDAYTGGNMLYFALYTFTVPAGIILLVPAGQVAIESMYTAS